MSEVSRPNFYELLEIDPSQPWSDGEFSKILKIKQGEWTKKTKIPKYKFEYTRSEVLNVEKSGTKFDIIDKKTK